MLLWFLLYCLQLAGVRSIPVKSVTAEREPGCQIRRGLQPLRPQRRKIPIYYGSPTALLGPKKPQFEKNPVPRRDREGDGSNPEGEASVLRVLARLWPWSLLQTKHPPSAHPDSPALLPVPEWRWRESWEVCPARSACLP